MRKLVLAWGLAWSLTPLSFAHALSQTEAEGRSRQISAVEYDLTIHLKPTREDFAGEEIIHFQFKPDGSTVGSFIELEDGKIEKLEVNGETVEGKASYDGHRITLTQRQLLTGTNTVRVVYTRAYVNNGNGLHRSQDIVDKAYYHFAHFEAYYAHLMFPCFDQPDLKAKFTLAVTAPADWEVISAMPGEAKSGQEGEREWKFPASPPLSTYVFSLAAGPFAVWSTNLGKLKLRLFARRSVAKYVEDKEWFAITKDVLDFYGKEFKTPYPFAKLDQILVPDFPAGAMENMGAITFDEGVSLFRSPQPRLTYVGRAGIIAHEIAHMWFGDLVTMRWWNGLWLNESFATFASALALANTPKYKKDAWPYFYSNSKRGGYAADIKVTTHPIELPVEDTDKARSIFDGITYGKGASALKQLHYYIGRSAFQKGVADYFHKFSFANTTLADFMDELGKASGKKLSGWQDEWLNQEGLNAIRVDVQCREGRVQSLDIVQTAPPEHPTLRTHRTRLGFYDQVGPILKRSPLMDVTYSGPATAVPAATGRRCPELVFPNEEDQDFVKVLLDPKSLETVRGSLHLVAEPFTRQMIWSSLAAMVRDAKLSPTEYVEIATAQLPFETDLQVLRDALDRFGPNLTNWLNEPTRGDLWTKMEAFSRARLNATRAGGDDQIIWFRNFLGLARSAESQAYLLSLLKGESELKGYRLDQDRRWDILIALARNGVADGKMLIDTEFEKDKTAQGRKRYYTGEAALPLPAIKRKWFDRITRGSKDAAENGLGAGDLRAALAGLSPMGQAALLKPFTADYFAALLRMANKEDNMYLGVVASGLFPWQDCGEELIRETADFIKKHPDLPASVIKALRESRQDAEICARLRKR